MVSEDLPQRRLEFIKEHMDTRRFRTNVTNLRIRVRDRDRRP